MRNTPAKKQKPSYSLSSVDNALRLIQLLRDTGSVRLSDAAAELGVSPSTAHRLMSMLIYRDFATQDEARNYHPGPSIGLGPVAAPWTRRLRNMARPHLEELSNRLDETTNLMIRVGTRVRFLTTVEATQALHVGDRQGVSLSALFASGGKALLAEMPLRSVEQLVTSRGAQISGDTFDIRARGQLVQELDSIRRLGYAVNTEGTEDGISAIGVAVHDADGAAIAALTVSVPSTRFARALEPSRLRPIFECRDDIESELRTAELRGEDQ